MESREFVFINRAKIRVFEDGRLKGDVSPVNDGWQFFPSGIYHMHGRVRNAPIFRTLTDCLNSFPLSD